jgi:hypothetical protein
MQANVCRKRTVVSAGANMTLVEVGCPPAGWGLACSEEICLQDLTAMPTQPLRTARKLAFGYGRGGATPHTCSVHGKMQVAMFSIVIVDKGLQDCAARRVCFSTRRSYAAMGLCAFHPSGPCLDARSHMIAGCLESPRPGGIPAQIPARPSYWAGSSQPIFRIFSVKQRRPVDAPRLQRRHPLC